MVFSPNEDDLAMEEKVLYKETQSIVYKVLQILFRFLRFVHYLGSKEANKTIFV